ncbi:sigma factor-like helix-turn-helix DNA-binding protein [Streptomyces hirsutus]|uniref:sigma factor-like helix-turn-helix DNA-binding protein n=1 Tax=Streptomyces hirsutus TaxID=35620 RepID=UPI0033B377CF
MTGIYRGSKPRVRVERSTELSQLVSSLPEPYAIAVLARVLYDASWSAIGERLGVDEDEARSHHTRGFLWLYRLSTAAQGEVLRSDARQGELIDEDLRILIRKWRLDEFAPVCAQCGRRCKPVVVKLLTLGNKGGRPRKYCSNACKQKVHRRRHR